MKRVILSLAAALALFLSVGSGVYLMPATVADAVTLEVPASVPEYQLVRCKLNDAATNAAWYVFPDAHVDIDEDDSGEMQFTAPPGHYTVVVFAVSADGITQQKREVVIEARDGPEPGPQPAPEPPEPPVIVSPFGDNGSYALFVYESYDQLPATQQTILTAKAVRDYLKAKNIAWRMFDDDAPLQNEAEAWRKAMASPRNSLPWLIVSHNGKWESVPLPANTDEAVKLLQKHFGA